MFLFFTFYLQELYSKQVVPQDRKSDAIKIVIVITSYEINKQLQSIKTEPVKAFGLGWSCNFMPATDTAQCTRELI